MINRLKTLLVALVAAASLTAFGQDVTPKSELKLPAKAVAGTTVTGQLILTFSEGLHAYQNPPTEDFQIPVKVTASKGTSLKKVMYPKGLPFLMNGDTKPSMVYQGKIVIPVAVIVGKRLGTQTVGLSIAYQQCNETSCFPPGTLAVTAKLTVTRKPS